MRFGDRLTMFRQCQGKRSDEVQLEQSDTAQAPSIQHFPVLRNWQWLDFERKVPLECPQDTHQYGFPDLSDDRVGPGASGRLQLWRDDGLHRRSPRRGDAG